MIVIGEFGSESGSMLVVGLAHRETGFDSQGAQ